MTGKLHGLGASLSGLLWMVTSAQAVEIQFQPVAPGIYVPIGDKGARAHDTEGLNANLGLVATPAGALLIDSGGQDHRWLGNGSFKAQGAEIIACSNAFSYMKKAVDDGVDVSAAVKSFHATPFLHLLNAAELMPGNARRTYLELERA